jgi:iron complex outermembrane recepter protein
MRWTYFARLINQWRAGRTVERGTTSKAWRYSLALTVLSIVMPHLSVGEEIKVPVREEIQLLKEESVSIAAQHEQPISEAPSNVYVITDEDIRHSGATDLPTVLRRIPGIEVIQMTGADFDVSARGDNQPRANKMLVLLDGRSIYLDVQGEVLWKLLPVTLPEIKRIEVLIGPASVLYGFNAFDGVINIITKSPEEIKGTTLQFGGGEFGTITAAAIQAGTVGKFGYRISAGRDQNNQWRSRDSLAFRDHKFNLQTEYNLPGSSKILFSGGVVDSNRFDGPYVDTVVSSLQPIQSYVNTAYERPNFFIRGYWTRVGEPGIIGVNPAISKFFRITDRNGTPNISLDWDSYNLETQHALDFGPTNRLTYGINYRHTAASSNFLDQFSREDRLGFYIQDEWHITTTLTAVAGVRADLHTEINPTYSPRVAFIYKVAPDHAIRLSGSVAQRPPTIFESHTLSLGNICIQPNPLPFCVANITTVLRGSPGVVPEQIISYEAGYQGWFFKHRLRTRLNLFFNHLSELIGQQFVSPTVLTFFNAREADIYGGEAGIEFLATPWLTGFANYSYEEISHPVVGNTVQRAGPRFKSNGGLRAEFENGLSGEAAVHYVGAATYPVNSFFFTASSFTGGVPAPNTRVGSYVLLNLRGAYRFWKERAEVAVTAFNALNDQHREHPLGDIISSRVMGWLTLKF